MIFHSYVKLPEGIVENARMHQLIGCPWLDLCIFYLLHPSRDDPGNIPGVSTREPIAATQRVPSGSVAPLIGPSTEARQWTSGSGTV